MNGTPPEPPGTARNSRAAERKRAKHELSDSEETLRTIASSAQDAILMLDNDGRIALWNAAAQRIFGYSSEEALGKDLHRLLVPERFHAAHRAAFPRFRSTGEGAAVGKTLELAALRKDGTEFPIELSLSAVMLKDKWCAIGIVRDISERKRAEEALRASEEQHRSLLAALAEGVVLQDASGALVMFNERAERMLGLTAAQLTGGLPIDPRWRAIREDESTFPGDAHPAMTTLKTGVPQSDVIMGVRKPDGTLTWLSINTQALVKPGQTTPDGVVSSFRDITEHRAAEERLRLASAVIENSPAVLFRWRAATGWPVEYVSSNVRQFGFTEEELLTGTVPFAHMVYRDDMERVAAEVARYTAGGCERFAQEYRLVTRDGAVRWVDDRTTIERDAAGEVKHYQGVLTDITDRKRAEENQRTAALYARSLIEASLDSLVTINAEGKITDVSKATEEVTGVARDRLVGTDFADYFTEPDQARAGYRQVLAEGYVRDYPLTIRHGSGRTTDVLYNASVYRNEAGELQGVFAAARDITERKRAEDTLRLSEEKYRTIFEESFDGLFVTSPGGRILDMNKKGVALFGYDTKEEIQRLDLEQDVYAHPPDRKRILALVDAQGTAEYEVEVKRKGGETMVTRCALTAVRDATGAIASYRGIISDITEKKRVERALHRVNRALKATSDCNMALIHATDEISLLDEMCRIIVDAGGYRLAWVGYAEHDAAKKVKPVAHGGYEPGYMERADITWADDERGSGPVGIAIRGGQVQVVQDAQTDPRFERWRANAARLGYGSVLVAPLLSEAGTIGALSIHAEGADAFDEREIALLSELAADMAFGIVTLRARRAHEQSAARLLGSMEDTIEVIGATVEMRDPYTAGHQLRVATLAAAIAQEMGLTEEQVHGIRLAGMVHDLGKVHIPSEILSKPGKLSRIEFELIKSHPEAGYEILKDVDFPWPIAQIVLQHHERLDGSGYPRGLKADEILLEARIMAVADVVEAMASHRPYRPALGIDLALREISENAGKYYDADAVRICLALFRDKAFAFNA
jgi:PAS domain S-box-containing protein/putative nucleotidyltransferase with HDIG domain